MKENYYDIIVGKYIEVYKPSYTGFQDWSNKVLQIILRVLILLHPVR